MRKVPQKLFDLAAGVVEGLDFELWGLELLPRQDQGQLLRVYIESPEGIDVEDCAKVSRQLGAVLDVEDPIHGEYTLEVSSPGMDRLLFEAQQFARVIGETVRVKLHATTPGRKNYKGLLLSVEGGQLSLQVDQEQVVLDLDQVDTARVVPSF